MQFSFASKLSSIFFLSFLLFVGFSWDREQEKISIGAVVFAACGEFDDTCSGGSGDPKLTQQQKTLLQSEIQDMRSSGKTDIADQFDTWVREREGVIARNYNAAVLATQATRVAPNRVRRGIREIQDYAKGDPFAEATALQHGLQEIHRQAYGDPKGSQITNQSQVSGAPPGMAGHWWFSDVGFVSNQNQNPGPQPSVEELLKRTRAHRDRQMAYGGQLQYCPADGVGACFDSQTECRAAGNSFGCMPRYTGGDANLNDVQDSQEGEYAAAFCGFDSQGQAHCYATETGCILSQLIDCQQGFVSPDEILPEPPPENPIEIPIEGLGDTDTGGIVPCGATGSGQMCTICHLAEGIYRIIDWGLRFLLVALAILMIVIAGVIYIFSAGNDGLMTSAKNLLKNVLIGFSVVLLSWIIITTLVNVLVGNNVTADGRFSSEIDIKGPWYKPEFNCNGSGGGATSTNSSGAANTAGSNESELPTAPPPNSESGGPGGV